MTVSLWDSKQKLRWWYESVTVKLNFRALRSAKPGSSYRHRTRHDEGEERLTKKASIHGAAACGSDRGGSLPPLPRSLAGKRRGALPPANHRGSVGLIFMLEASTTRPGVPSPPK
jgi:hypothetical protein